MITAAHQCNEKRRRGAGRVKISQVETAKIQHSPLIRRTINFDDELMTILPYRPLCEPPYFCISLIKNSGKTNFYQRRRWLENLINEVVAMKIYSFRRQALKL